MGVVGAGGTSGQGAFSNPASKPIDTHTTTNRTAMKTPCARVTKQPLCFSSMLKDKDSLRNMEICSYSNCAGSLYIRCRFQVEGTSAHSNYRRPACLTPRVASLSGRLLAAGPGLLQECLCCGLPCYPATLLPATVGIPRAERVPCLRLHRFCASKRLGSSAQICWTICARQMQMHMG